MINKKSIIALADGTIFEGVSIGVPGEGIGELVFNTAMTGYQEMLTDPSYAKQILTLTTAHVGNTGCNEEDQESSRVWASGLVLRDCSSITSNYRSETPFLQWLREQGVVAIAGVDTRALTLHLQKQGALGACITTAIEDRTAAIRKAQAFSGLQGVDLASVVSRKEEEIWQRGRQHAKACPPSYDVIVYDYGVKNTILKILVDKGARVTVVPARTPAEEVLQRKPNGIVLSNGPGDPLACDYAITQAQTFVQAGLPLLGICLGFQLLGLAMGAKSEKMKFGHHGANHPVIEVKEKGKVMITSQNHGFSIQEASLPDCLTVTHRSLFDNTLQGFQHKTKPILGFQGHPEASPGPHDIENIFDSFFSMMRSI